MLGQVGRYTDTWKCSLPNQSDMEIFHANGKRG